MKKLRMIVTSVIVLTVICSAFTFKVKGGGYCVVSSTDPATDCTMTISSKMVVTTGGTLYKYAPWWNGNTVTCTAANNGLCTAGPIRFNQD